MTWSGQAQFQNLTIVAAADITTSYLSAVTISSPAVMIAVKNGTNGDVLFSFDKTNAKWGFPSLSGTAYDIRTNSPTTSNLMLPANTNLSIKWNGSAPVSPSGNLYIEIMEVQIA